ncbi:hypothetical protein SAMN02745157_4484 [Kaistia soli DSM 19436]|uniref:Uncharacterized protein n=2 Tax=Kaistia TaxID=166953 RepID=A0A1M5L483_9HYPH|nr:hypothetical protein SAMN02745157_4484 [Kaistia soli DSM 19436]
MLARSAVYGFGASFGRDAYKGAKQASGAITVLAVLFLTIWGYRGLARNIGNRTRSEVIARVLGSVFAICAGTYLSGSVAIVVFSVTLPWLVGVHIVSAIVGLLWGRAQKRNDETSAEIELSNVEFMEANGLHDSPFDADLIEDGDGNRLRVKETRDDAIVFMVVGRRGLRAVISLDSGRMVEYSGLVRL